MTPTIAKPTLWEGERVHKNDRLEPFYTEIEFRDGRVIPHRKAYRVKGSYEYGRRPEKRGR